MTELKIEDLKVGDELVCVDRDGFLNERRNAEYLLHNKMIVTDVNEHETYLLCEKDEKSCRNYIYSHELKYFKKKEQSQYTFDDLIDVANDAVKNKLITQTRFSLSAIDTPLLIVVYFEGREGRYTDDNFLNGIEFIKSLYQETFTIERKDDIKRVKSGANIVLSNSVSLTAHNVFCDYIIVTKEAHASYDIDVLKGATVTQSK